MSRVIRSTILFALLSLLPAGKSVAQNPVEFSPVADAGAIVISGNARFTILTPAMIRLEWSPNGVFEDRASLTFINRKLPIPEYSTRNFQGWLVIDTGELEIRYKEGGGKFAPENLAIEIHSMDSIMVWRPEMADTANLGGTVRTLDSVDGPTPLEPGLVSRDGWVLVDDSENLLLTNDPTPWPTPRRDAEALDWVFFGYGHDYGRALDDYTKVSGKIPFPPLYTFGAWWSRYWAYTDQELKDLVNEYDKRDIPLDVLVVDMDWHLDGWTGYTWNKKYFPDPEGFLKWMHDKGLKVTLNLHPHNGVQPHEAQFEKFSRAMGNDPPGTKGIKFDIADPLYMKNYFEILHHPLEKQGVDFWWIDWQQGEESKITGLDPLFWLNHLHWMDMENNPVFPDRRPLLFSRWGGLGSHRYQIGFSGDTHSSWETLKFQSEFTATAGNVGFDYWSHDIGGHYPGTILPELYARWIQYAAFNPVLRTHTTKNSLAERRIWAFDDEIYQNARKFFRLRYQLLPYIYTTARQTWDDATPMVKPLYWEWPELEEAYEYGDEYLFGPELLVAPISSPRNKASRVAVRDVWFPPGKWTHIFTKETFEGPGVAVVTSTLEDIPVFARGGAIIPFSEPHERTSVPLNPLILRVFPGEKGEYALYEDDGSSQGYQRGEFARTTIRMETVEGVQNVTVEPAEGQFPGMLETRNVLVQFEQCWPAQMVKLDGREIGRVASGKEAGTSAAWWYDPQNLAVVVAIPEHSVHDKATISVTLADRDIAPLAQGLLAKFDLLSELVEKAGESTPEKIAGVVKSFKEFGVKGGDDPAELLSMVTTEWRGLLDVILASDMPDSIKNQAFLRMLDLNVSFSLDTEAGKYVASVRVDALEPVKDLTTNVKFTSPGDWKIAGPVEESGNLLKKGEPWIFKARYTPGPNPQPGRFAAKVLLTTKQGEVSIPWEAEVNSSILSWYVLGPFDCQRRSDFDKKLKPEKHLKSPKLDRAYRGMGKRKVKWQRVQRDAQPDTRPNEEYRVDLQQLLGPGIRDAAAYAMTYLQAPRDMEVQFEFGTDDGVAVWLNGEELYRLDVGRAYVARGDKIILPLKQGINVLVLKVSQRDGGWSFGGHIVSPDGTPQEEVLVIPGK